MRRVSGKTKLIASLAAASMFAAAFPVFAGSTATTTATSTETHAQIDAETIQIKELEQEIAQYESELNVLNSSAQTLQTNVDSLNTTKTKLTKQIQLAKSQISQAGNQITVLTSQINTNESKVENDQKILSGLILAINQDDSTSEAEALLNSESLSTFFDYRASVDRIENALQQNVADLQNVSQTLKNNESESESKKAELLNLQNKLNDQKNLVQYSQTQVNQLLTSTKDKQSNYQALLDQKIALRNSFNQEMVNFESQLNLKINPNSVPTPSPGILLWPLDIGKIIITQYFGNTAFAKANPQVYDGMGHNGVDIAASIGTPVLAAMEGIVQGTGNTDLTCPNASWGKWVLIQHPNGLSTLYAHLSIIKATTGESVQTGDVIGYSGETGYATGPHLHFTVYASEGVQILQKPSKVCNATYTMPLADLQAYLNPLSYLPTL